MRANYLFTSESVAEGHPDKVCDRISDEIVDLVYREAAKTGIDPWTVRIACETLATTNRVVEVVTGFPFGSSGFVDTILPGKIVLPMTPREQQRNAMVLACIILALAVISRASFIFREN